MLHNMIENIFGDQMLEVDLSEHQSPSKASKDGDIKAVDEFGGC